MECRGPGLGLGRLCGTFLRVNAKDAFLPLLLLAACGPVEWSPPGGTPLQRAPLYAGSSWNADKMDYFYDGNTLVAEFGGRILYGYDGRGLLSTRTDDLGTATYHYDSADRLVEIDGPSAGTSNRLRQRFEYDAGDRLVRWVREQGTVGEDQGPPSSWELFEAETFLYDANGRLTESSYDHGDGWIIERDAQGRRIASQRFTTVNGLRSLVEQREEWVWGPDGALSERWANGSILERYHYDATGQIAARQLFDGSGTSPGAYEVQRTSEADARFWLGPWNVHEQTQFGGATFTFGGFHTP